MTTHVNDDAQVLAAPKLRVRPSPPSIVALWQNISFCDDMNQNQGAPGEADVGTLPVSVSPTRDEPNESMGSEPQQYAVGHRANLEQSAIERAMGPMRQVSSIDIGQLESEMKATGKDMAKDREIISLMRKADGKGNGNGRLDVTEAVAIIHDTAEVRLSRSPCNRRQPPDACTRARSRASTSSGCASG